MEKEKVLSLEDRIPKIKEHRRRKANRRLIFLLSLFFLLIVCVVYFQSPLSQINKIDVLGNETVTVNETIKITGIQTGMNIWKVDKKQAEKKLTALPQIKTASVKVGFPNNIDIRLEEYKVIAFSALKDVYVPILENGAIIKKAGGSGVYGSAPLLSNFQEDAVLEELILQLQQLSPEILNAISEIQSIPKKTDKYRIYVFMNDGYEINATIPTFAEKMDYYPSIVSQLDPNVKGVIDLEVGSYFKAHEWEGVNEDEENDEE